MSNDLLKEISGGNEFQQSLGQIRDGRQDYEAFFDEALRRLEATLGEAVREQQAWEAEKGQAQSELDEQAAELDRRHKDMQSQRESFLKEALIAAQEKFKERFDEKLEKMLQERDADLQDRAAVDAELEKLRQRTAELMGSLEEQKRSAAEQQSQWSEQLRRHGLALELILQKTSNLESAAAAAKANEAAAKAVEGNSALSSVLSQFEVLQRDIARRRNKPTG